MVQVGWMDSPVFDRHAPLGGHPESPARLNAIRARLAATGLSQRLVRGEPRPVDQALLETVHDASYLQLVARLEARGGGSLDPEGDTWVGPGTLEAALMAAGAVVDAVEKVLQGEWTRAFCSVRPPGHHARRGAGMGFCIFNNVVIGAAAALQHAASRRVAIVDFDVHHGNGTEELLAGNPDALYASLHQSPLYPDTGAAGGSRAGELASSIRCPLRAGAGDREFLRAIDAVVLPALEQFEPDLLLLSAGFDADARDPLADLCLTSTGFREVTRRLVQCAGRVCAGRVVSVLEGGYQLAALAEDAEVHVAALLEPNAGEG